ncbi:cupin domain-containing protein [Reichenbachiella versicolor]|uniref:cupin domain-containing protein n=1 Tax=Reichenbachiella versicolor TaxID=1821036 RepID=UPI000D6E3953|nr:cupin domain-containing protein [Reichenbachiella versicolor]
MSVEENYKEDLLQDNAMMIEQGEGERLELSTLSITFKVTSEMSNDQLGVYEISLPPLAIGAKLHYHRFMDETFIVNEGTVTIQTGDKEYQAHPGTVIYVPRLTPHGFKNDTNDSAKLTLIFNPSQKREGFFRDLLQILSEDPVDPQKYLKLYNKYDSFPVDETNMIPIRQ